MSHRLLVVALAALLGCAPSTRTPVPSPSPVLEADPARPFVCPGVADFACPDESEGSLSPDMRGHMPPSFQCSCLLDGVAHGRSVFVGNGRLRGEHFLDHGTVRRAIEWYPDNETMFYEKSYDVYGRPDGVWRRWYSNGQLQAEVHFDGGVRRDAHCFTEDAEAIEACQTLLPVPSTIRRGERTCRVDEDCTRVTRASACCGCASGPVNQRSLKRVERRIDRRCGNTPCPQVKDTGPSCSAAAVCLGGLCELRAAVVPW